MDSSNPTTRDYAVTLAKKYPGSYNIDQVLAIYNDLRPNWKYVNDPSGADYFAKASESIRLGLAGDCDDFAITMAALITAIGGTARVMMAEGTTPETRVDRTTGAHAWAEVYIGPQSDAMTQKVLQSVANKYQATVNSHTDSKGGVWLNLDWWAKNPGGPFYIASDGVAIYPGGTHEVLRFV